jgi:hypothetical protein
MNFGSFLQTVGENAGRSRLEREARQKQQEENILKMLQAGFVRTPQPNQQGATGFFDRLNQGLNYSPEMDPAPSFEMADHHPAKVAEAQRLHEAKENKARYEHEMLKQDDVQAFEGRWDEKIAKEWESKLLKLEAEDALRVIQSKIDNTETQHYLDNLPMYQKIKDRILEANASLKEAEADEARISADRAEFEFKEFKEYKGARQHLLNNEVKQSDLDLIEKQYFFKTDPNGNEYLWNRDPKAGEPNAVLVWEKPPEDQEEKMLLRANAVAQVVASLKEAGLKDQADAYAGLLGEDDDDMVVNLALKDLTAEEKNIANLFLDSGKKSVGQILHEQGMDPEDYDYASPTGVVQGIRFQSGSPNKDVPNEIRRGRFGRGGGGNQFSQASGRYREWVEEKKREGAKKRAQGIYSNPRHRMQGN